MKTYKLFTNMKKITGPDILGAAAARKELAAIVRSEKIYVREISGRRASVAWSGDRLACVISYSQDSGLLDVWDRYQMKEKGES